MNFILLSVTICFCLSSSYSYEYYDNYPSPPYYRNRRFPLARARNRPNRRLPYYSTPEDDARRLKLHGKGYAKSDSSVESDFTWLGRRDAYKVGSSGDSEFDATGELNNNVWTSNSKPKENRKNFRQDLTSDSSTSFRWVHWVRRRQELWTIFGLNNIQCVLTIKFYYLLFCK